MTFQEINFNIFLKNMINNNELGGEGLILVYSL